jgi:hypothetical protein
MCSSPVCASRRDGGEGERELLDLEGLVCCGAVGLCVAPELAQSGEILKGLPTSAGPAAALPI